MKLPKFKLPKISLTTKQLNIIVVVALVILLFLATYTGMSNMYEGFTGDTPWQLTTSGNNAVMNYKGDSIFSFGPTGALTNKTIQKLQKTGGPTGPAGAVGATGAPGAAGVCPSDCPTGDVGPMGPTGADSTVAGPTGPTGPAGAVGGLGGVPAGVIVAYHGSTAPPGWAICDGTSPTPDLTDRFILGTTSKSKNGSYGATGGSWTITSDQIPSHTHGYTQNPYYSRNLHAGSDSVGAHWSAGHQKPYTRNTAATGGGKPYYQPYFKLMYIMKLAANDANK